MDWRTWNTQGQVLTQDERQIDYDARSRPWFKGAMAQTSSEGMYWIDPYTFFTN